VGTVTLFELFGQECQNLSRAIFFHLQTNFSTLLQKKHLFYVRMELKCYRSILRILKLIHKIEKLEIVNRFYRTYIFVRILCKSIIMYLLSLVHKNKNSNTARSNFHLYISLG